MQGRWQRPRFSSKSAQNWWWLPLEVPGSQLMWALWGCAGESDLSLQSSARCGQREEKKTSQARLMTKPPFQMWTLKPSGRTLQQEKDEFGKGAAVESCTSHLSWKGSRITLCHVYKSHCYALPTRGFTNNSPCCKWPSASSAWCAQDSTTVTTSTPGLHHLGSHCAETLMRRSFGCLGHAPRWWTGRTTSG